MVDVLAQVMVKGLAFYDQICSLESLITGDPAEQRCAVGRRGHPSPISIRGDRCHFTIQLVVQR
jgi:hypothetical protein